MRRADEADARKKNDFELGNSVSFSDDADTLSPQAGTILYSWDRVLVWSGIPGWAGEPFGYHFLTRRGCPDRVFPEKGV